MNRRGDSAGHDSDAGGQEHEDTVAPHGRDDSRDRDDGQDGRTSGEPAGAGEGLATVHYLTGTTRPDSRPDHGPDSPDETEPGAVEVLEGRVLDGAGFELDSAGYELDRAGGPATGPGTLVAARTALATTSRTAVQVGRVTVRVGRFTVQVATNERVVLVAKVVCRHLLYVPAGLFSFARRGWEARTTARYERMMRSAEAAGNAELLADWQARAEEFKAARYARMMGWLAAPVVAARSLLVGAFTLLCSLLVLGAVLASARHDWGMVLAPYNALVAVISGAVDLARTVSGPAVRVAPWVLLAALWNEGRRRMPSPTWLATAEDADIDIDIDETTIARALLALRIPQITAALKLGPLAFVTTARRDGRGTHAIVRLPIGVTAEKIARRRADLATGLYRRAKEVWPTTGSEEGILDLWVADKGALAEGAGPYPLLAEGVVDLFKGVPYGKTLRGDPVVLPIIDRNTIAGGMPSQGKSSAARVTFAGAALDPTAELRIWVPDSNYDFEAFRPRCSQYVMGAEKQQLAAILQGLRDLDEELQVRGELLVKYQVPSVTRALADKGVGLHPLLCLLEEAHILLQDKDYGPEACELVVNIVRICRKRGVHMFLSTQAPTASSIPRDATRNCSNGIAFAVGDHVANDALLGQGAYKAGHRATELIPGLDAGTAVVKGFGGTARSAMVQAYFIDIDKSHDQITPIIKRSLDALAERGLPVPGTTPGAGPGTAPVPATRDLLADLAAVLGSDVVPVADMPALLAKAHPTWTPYRGMTGKTLREILAAEHGVKVPSTGNRYPLDPVTIRDALTRRSLTEEPGTGDDDTGPVSRS